MKRFVNVREVISLRLVDRIANAVEKIRIVSRLVTIDVDQPQLELARKTLDLELAERDKLSTVFGNLALREIVAQCPRSSADAIARLENAARDAGLSQAVGAREPGNAGPHDDHAAVLHGSRKKNSRPLMHSRKFRACRKRACSAGEKRMARVTHRRL